MEFNFDLSDDSISTDTSIVVKEAEEKAKQIKIANKITDLTPNQKCSIDNALWYGYELSNSEMINYIIESIGVGEVLATNIVHVHREKYLGNKGVYTIFDLSKRALGLQESHFKQWRHEQRKKSRR